jgi:inositol transport system substrate-binding protein
MPKSVVLCLTEENNDFQQLLMAEAEQAARRAGVDLDVHFTGHDLAAQLQTLARLAGASPAPDAILALAVRDRGLARAARDAAQAGISFIYLNRTEDDVEAIRAAAPRGVAVAVVCADELETGHIHGRQMRALLPKGGRVLYVQGSTRSLAARDRTAGMQEAVKGTAIEVSLLEGGWAADEAREAARRWLAIVARNQRIDLVGCQNDQIALGVLDALVSVGRELGKPDLARTPVLGCDGTPSVGQALVRQGQLVATVVLPRSSGRAVELVARTLASGEVPPALVMLPPRSLPEEGALSPLQAR